MTPRADLVAHARQVMTERLLREPAYAQRAGEIAVVLCGSVVTEYADAYSGLDFLVLTPDGSPPPAPPPADGRAQRFRVISRGLEEFQSAAFAADDEALFLATHGVVLHDSTGRASVIWRDPPEPPAAVWEEKVQSAFRELRRRRASLAWALRRGQPYAFLEGITGMLGHALRICFYAEHVPPPPAKWLHGAGLRTGIGRSLRAPLLDLLNSLGDTAVLGGSLHLKQNRLYQRCDRLEATLARALTERGIRPLRPAAGRGAAAERGVADSQGTDAPERASAPDAARTPADAGARGSRARQGSRARPGGGRRRP